MKNKDWIFIKDGSPSSGQRCLVNDGVTVVIGTYVEQTWLLEGINSSIPYKIIGWMPLPLPLEEIVEPSKENEKTVAKN